MQATAHSRIANISGTIHDSWSEKTERDINADPRRDMRRWPAIRFAVRRTQRVIGRIRFLVSSINTMKFIRGKGVPWGKRWDSM